MNEENLKKLKLRIDGTHCASCEVLIERKFKKIDGVEHVRVQAISGKAVLYCSTVPSLVALQQSIGDDGYVITAVNNQPIEDAVAAKKNTAHDYAQIGAIAVIILGVYLILQRFNLLPAGLGVNDKMSYGFIFLVGLLASISTCMAVTGGLLLAVSAKYSENHPTMTPAQKFKPLLYFNVGRLSSYALLGGAVGALGSVFSLSPTVNGIITILASLAMIVLGLQLLHLFPRMQRLGLKPPKALSHKIHDLTDSNSKTAPLLLGGMTFFLPCGFTQALQLYVLSQGGFFHGMLVMSLFALGTLPALLSVSALSSFIKGTPQIYLLKFAGVMALLLGLFNVQNGLVLAGSPINAKTIFGSNQAQSATVSNDPNVTLVNGRQVVKMKVVGASYIPSRFTVKKGIPVDWEIDGSQAAGCLHTILMPKMGISAYLPSQGTKIVSFTPTETGMLPFNCPMGMGTYGAGFTVVDNAGTANPTNPVAPPAVNTNSAPTNAVIPPAPAGGIPDSACDPRFDNCPAT